MLAVLITLTPGCQYYCIDCQKAKVWIAVLPIMDVKTRWNSTLEFLDQAYRLWEFTCQWLKNSNYSDYRPLFTTLDEWTITKDVMEVLRLFWYWILWMSKRYTVTLHYVITVNNDMFDHMDGVMWALTKRRHNGRKTYTSRWWLGDRSCSNILMKSLQQPVCFSIWHISFILSESCNHLGSDTTRWIPILRTTGLILLNTRQRVWSMWRKNTATNIDEYLSLNPTMSTTTIFSPLQEPQDLNNHRLTHMIYPAIIRNT